MATRPARSDRLLAPFLTVAVLLLVFSALSGASIGLFIIPIPLVMFGSVAAWSRPWIVAGLVAGAVAGSLTFLLTAPLVRFERALVEIGGANRSAGLGGCERSILPDVPLEECDDARSKAIGIAGVSALVFGFGVGFPVRAAVRPRRS
jgi:hypothetical protein